MSEPPEPQPPQPHPGPGGTARRLPWLDAARGAAVVAMVVYHGAWDLSELGFLRSDIRASVGWGLFARAIAGSFLALSGVGLVLAHRRGFRASPFLRRLAIVSAAALAVTVATAFAFPSSYIFFGILHNVAVSSLVALPFLRAPAWLAALAGAGAIALPFAVANPIFDHDALLALGLGTTVPFTNDYVPVFPWTGFVLLGIAAARTARAGRRDPAPARTRRPLRLLAALGRHSLLIYLLHQPAMFGTLSGLRAVLGPDEVAEEESFLRSCATACEAARSEPALCRSSCRCTVDELRRDGLWRIVMEGRATAEERGRAEALAGLCLRSPPG